MKSKHLTLIVAVILVSLSAPVLADNYKVDIKGAHAFIQFKIKHLGFSWLLGRFDKFDGKFSYDEKNPEASKVKIIIDTASINSNHAVRDKHLRDEKLLDVKTYPTATFESTAFKELGDGKVQLTGNFMLHGVTKSINIDVEHIGHGDDPWGEYRRGFAGTTILKLKDYGIERDLGPASQEVEMFLSIEGIKI
jgi:polyisoprenoid-binding protein YceI